MTVRAALYLRVSTERQAERDLSIPNQRRQIEAFCTHQNLQIVVEYSDAGISARSARRPDFQKMISDAGQKPRPFDEVVVYNWSRFFRDATEALFYLRKLEGFGVRVRAVTQDVTDDASGRLLRTILAATDVHASEMIGERTLGGMEENVRQGYVNGTAPFGFRSVTADHARTASSPCRRADPQSRNNIEVVARVLCERELQVTGIAEDNLPAAVDRYWHCVAAEIEAGLIDESGVRLKPFDLAAGIAAYHDWRRRHS